MTGEMAAAIRDATAISLNSVTMSGEVRSTTRTPTSSKRSASSGEAAVLALTDPRACKYGNLKAKGLWTHALRETEFDRLIAGLEKPQKRLLGTLVGAWVGAGATPAIWWGATCVVKEDGRLGLLNAWCAELALFGFVCWISLGLI